MDDQEQADDAPRLYYWETIPGQRDHLEGYWFESGTLLAQPSEAARVEEALGRRHTWDYVLRPAEEGALDFAAFEQVGGGLLRSTHSIHDTAHYDEDEPWIALAEA